MTSVETRVRSDLLYLVIDMPDSPTYAQYAAQVSNLDVILNHCVKLLRPELKPDASGNITVHRPFALIYPTYGIARTSMGSPWITVVSDVLRNSAPAGYSLIGLFALQRLMNMIMEWQAHREDIRTRKTERQSLEALLRNFEAEVKPKGAPQMSDVDDVYTAVQNLNRVAAADLMDEDDSRARGQGE